ncbi:MAG: DNA polymerase III subunit delta, partial [Pseudomonadota bacterium]
MVALKGKAITGALARRDAAIAAFLVYGPDQGLVRERAKTLMAQVISDTTDPFNMLDLTDADIKADGARLTDEICALSFMGGERVIRLRAHGEA